MSTPTTVPEVAVRELALFPKCWRMPELPEVALLWLVKLACIPTVPPRGVTLREIPSIPPPCPKVRVPAIVVPRCCVKFICPPFVFTSRDRTGPIVVKEFVARYALPVDPEWVRLRMLLPFVPAPNALPNVHKSCADAEPVQ